ncbi:non-ribosomal peptide synthetase [Oscillatoria sp. HE19RPO]|uniref:non-ribosomal peptide synthetase n=1 Tax=Oscillatoria sp. HE19RPO TaxID=2954806 RepID=UPI0020C263E2|nr:non-ribosomal peptide synthetase [Oscillatoria sp. HE19RPO]
MSDISQRIASLSPEKRALLLQRLQQKNPGTASTNTIACQPRSTDTFISSFSQARLWFLDRLEPNSSFYNLPYAIRLTGVLHIPALEQSLTEIVRRHEVIRTTFKEVAGEPMQIINPAQPVTLATIDLRQVPPSEQEGEALRLATREAQTPFNLTTGPLLRSTLLQLDDTEYIVLFTLHHIVSDGWSTGVIIRELAALYQAFSQGKPSPLPELPIQYADFAVWQRGYLQGEVLDAQLSYWKQHLKNAPAALDLPGDRPRVAVQTYQGATESTRLSKSLTEALKALSKAEGVTLFMTLLAGFKTLLYRYSGQENIVVGSPIANRNRAEIEDAVGFFVNSLALHTDLGGNPTVQELLHRVRDVSLGAYSHQDLPFEKLVEELHPERDLSRSPIFQVMFVLQNAPTTTLELPGLTLQSLAIERGTTQFDLSLSLTEYPEGLAASIEYSTDLFERESIVRMLGYLKTVLEAMVADPTRRICEISLLTEAERHQLLMDWSNAGRWRSQPETLENSCIHHLFETQVNQSPDVVAVQYQDAHLTYRELNAKANQLAHYLQGLGVGPDSLVGLCCDRSLEMLVGLLGILKAGGAYLPLDPAYPRDRLQGMLEDAAVPILLTQQQIRDKFTPLSAQAIALDADWQAISEYSPENPLTAVTPNHLAYVIYTSGSTGKPKGVAVPHRALVAYTQVAQTEYGITQRDRLLQFASISFDTSAEEIYPSLTCGATLILRTETMIQSIAEFLHQCQDWEMTVLNLPTAYWHELTARLAAENLTLPPAVRMVIIGGEKALPDRLKTWQQQVGKTVQLLNTYGPTETTIVAAKCDLSQVEAGNGREVPIGYPLPHTEIYVLDSHLQPVPIGVPGELHIGGKGLARGYLNRPELTNEKFIPHPFSTSPGDRLYKTGDLGRWLPDGKLEVIGRSDRQIKLRGYRIELSEIEATLAQHPAVWESVAVCREDTPNLQQLVSYFVLNPQFNLESQVSTLIEERLSQWQVVHDDENFNETDSQWDSTFNISGWDSSYTGLPIPELEMREWVNNTVSRILDLKPNRVLEIGCGTGLMLFKIAPHCTQYWGSDFSPASLNHIRQQLAQPGQNLPQVKLLERMADNFEGIESQSFDAVIINSVIQYFPTVDYLLQVIEGSLNAVAPGGMIFLGDLRSYPLLEAFNTSIELYQAPASLSLEKLQQRIKKRLIEEEELAISPEFFRALKQQFPQISRVEIQPKQGIYHNELNKFRYDVTLHLGPETPAVPQYSEWDWQQEGLTLDSLRDRLDCDRPNILALRSIPNARVLGDIKAVELLVTSSDIHTVDGLQKAVKQAISGIGIDPENLAKLGTELGYLTVFSWLNSSRDGSYDTLFIHPNNAPMIKGSWGDLLYENHPISIQPWNRYTNNPLQGQQRRHLVGELRQYLQQKLPEYAVPSAFVILEHLPLTPNGKVDRKALPAPDTSRPDMQGTFVAPRTILEEKIAGIWSEILGLEKVGIEDNFFDLGGHSLLITQLSSRVRDTFTVDLPLRDLFAVPTVAGLAQQIERATQQESPVVNISFVDFQAEIVLNGSFSPVGTFQFNPNPAHILLTGATGFLGAFLLEELLQKTSAEIYCLVRASNAAEAKKRIQSNLETYKLWRDSLGDRIIPLVGNLAKPRLGLSAEQFQALAHQIDVIYHNGALVNFTYPYSAVKAANVESTLDLLKLANQIKLKPLHFISTVGLFDSTATEDDELANIDHLEGGYIQSKWVAEKLLMAARDRGFPINIYRPGRITGHSQTGACNINDFVHRIIGGCIQLGSAPNWNTEVEMVPVDYVSRAIVHLSQQPESMGKNFHLVNSQTLPWGEFVSWVRSQGYPLEPVTYPQWREQLHQQAANSTDNALYPLLSVFSDSGSGDRTATSSPLEIGDRNTQTALQGTDITCPPVGEKLLITYFSYLVRSGYLPNAQKPARV